MLNSSKKVKIRLGLALAAVAALGVLAAWLWPRPSYTLDGTPIPPWGLVRNPNSDNFGNPEVTIADLERLYAAIKEYADKTGELPHPMALVEASDKGELVNKVTLDDTISEDFHLSDRYEPERTALEYQFSLMAPRPDGTPKPAHPAEGERDVWVVAPTYARRNTKVWPNHDTERRLAGFYLVLWSDGEIERVPTGDMLYVNTAEGLVNVFEGQAGLQKSQPRSREATLLGAKRQESP